MSSYFPQFINIFILKIELLWSTVFCPFVSKCFIRIVVAGLYQLGNQPLVRFPTNASSGGQSSVIHIADGSGNHAPALLLPGNSSVHLGSVSVASVANSANVAARKNPQTFVSQLDGRDDDEDEFEDLSDADLDSPPSSLGKPPPKKQKVSRSPMSETERLEKVRQRFAIALIHQ